MMLDTVEDNYFFLIYKKKSKSQKYSSIINLTYAQLSSNQIC